MEQISGYWEFGARWASRLLQDALAGIEPLGDGLLDVWLQVANERRAVVTLAAHGVSSLGAHLFFASDPPHRIRMSTARLTADSWPVLDRVMHSIQVGGPATGRPVRPSRP